MAQLELLWAAAALMLLGAAVSLCVKCQLSGTKREKQPRERRSQKATEELGACRHAGYEDCLRGDAAYVEPISLDYYNCVRFFTPPNEKEEDSHSYQNVVIGVSHSSDPVTDDAADYENSPAIHIWKLQHAEAPQTESPDDEPDYVNAAPASGPALPSKQR
ncbi:PREDICTED: linker for activation of T-cells family member 2-like [Charadrius vociferus]|uniref:linker for activation of T-cells family member 2-like n=1 Tax=Charadrius vociferus TaxID=50402 RepID=UPI000521C23E|nr:PREDICTED: linker for activation of T-cells family member 2-like [Charadrius vociferus]